MAKINHEPVEDDVFLAIMELVAVAEWKDLDFDKESLSKIKEWGELHSKAANFHNWKEHSRFADLFDKEAEREADEALERHIEDAFPMWI